MTTTLKSGLFISLEGVDRSGKSTQCQLLTDWLCTQKNVQEVIRCVDPGGTSLGTQLREILLTHRGHMALTCEALLFMASRAQLVEEVIRPALMRGSIVIADRFLLSTVVYQGHAGGLNPSDLWHWGRLATGDLLPDLTFVLDAPINALAHRRKKNADRIESRGEAFFESLRNGFLIEAKSHQMIVIDAMQSIDLVQQQIRVAIDPLLS